MKWVIETLVLVPYRVVETLTAHSLLTGPASLVRGGGGKQTFMLCCDLPPLHDMGGSGGGGISDTATLTRGGAGEVNDLNPGAAGIVQGG